MAGSTAGDDDDRTRLSYECLATGRERVAKIAELNADNIANHAVITRDTSYK